MAKSITNTGIPASHQKCHKSYEKAFSEISKAVESDMPLNYFQQNRYNWSVDFYGLVDWVADNLVPEDIERFTSFDYWLKGNGDGNGYEIHLQENDDTYFASFYLDEQLNYLFFKVASFPAYQKPGNLKENLCALMKAINSFLDVCYRKSECA